MTQSKRIELGQAWYGEERGDGLYFSKARVVHSTEEFGRHPWGNYGYRAITGLFAEISLNGNTHHVEIPNSLQKRLNIQEGGLLTGVYQPYDMNATEHPSVSTKADYADVIQYYPPEAI